MNWQVAGATAEDIEAMRTLTRTADDDMPSLAILTAAACGEDDKGALLASAQGQLLGYILYARVLDELTVLNVLVTPRWRRRGVAKGLMTAVFERGPSMGIVRYLLEVRRSNHAAIGLYRHMGFVVDGVRKDYYPAGNAREDAQMMSLNLADPREQQR